MDAGLAVLVKLLGVLHLLRLRVARAEEVGNAHRTLDALDIGAPEVRSELVNARAALDVVDAGEGDDDVAEDGQSMLLHALSDRR